ncbi:MAG: DEAD/DEAH box helicase [Verrucomicrobiae bacterium]|nr:DEAD/DEAH box helicase [Verrucomicrobiae bacterium]
MAAFGNMVMTGPKHPNAQSFVKRGLFHELMTFCELEARLSALPTQQDRGNAFEVFAEAYLVTQSIAQAREVWPCQTTPPSILKRLALDTRRDMGVDGVLQTTRGEFNAYQVKFRSGRPSLTWDELSTFMGLADKVGQRVLFTNCNDLPALMKDRGNFYCIRGNDLDRLEPRDFEAILRWLESGVVVEKKKEPMPHQREALGNILPALETDDRVTAIMACGTGKTLVALWVAENVIAARGERGPNVGPHSNILVLVPSLALLRQTLHEWLKETRWKNVAYLCVCSDPSVQADADDLVVRQSDLDFPVTTDSNVVRQFLSKNLVAQASLAVKVVFSTYHSADVVAAGMGVGHVPSRGESGKAPDGGIGPTTFDLGIFDEAHKTAGREGLKFSFALKDENLPIKKRLFVTATPRHYDVRKRDKEGDAVLVYSMDNPVVYGPVAHKLTFAEAARRGIICNYKVIISVITSQMINDEMLRCGEVIVGGESVKARQVANQVALKEAVKKFGVRKIFTFHRSVASAKSFTSDGPEGVGQHLNRELRTANREPSSFQSFHVNGSMPTAYRERLMNEFRAAENAIISNAKCLTEGVDVPAVDMVAFLTPKRSRVDIVQATGRAMRKAPGKTTGYVLVPLFVEQAKGETIEQAVARAEFDEVWNILQAMQEQDEVLADIIRQMREQRGQTRSFDDKRFREKVNTICSTVSLDLLRASITSGCVDKLGLSWDENYGQLLEYKHKHHNCNVPTGWPKKHKLSTWVASQRIMRSKEMLPDHRVARLDQIGFVWDVHEAAWNTMFSELVAFKRAYGHCDVPTKWTGLSGWVRVQCRFFTTGKLSEARIHRLNEIGFNWNISKSPRLAWERMFDVLLQYKKFHGDCNVPPQFDQNPKFTRWVAAQRAQRKKGILDEERIQRLDEIGFNWGSKRSKNSVWEKMFLALVEYKREHGDCNVASTYSKNQQLRTWISTQRQSRRQGSLCEEHIRKLDGIGFIWNVHDRDWERMFAALVEYKRTHGNCSVPINWGENPNLSNWVVWQSVSRKKANLSEARIRRLDEIGFNWGSNRSKNSVWEKMFLALVKYKEEHGDCNISTHIRKNAKLARWVAEQRTRKWMGTLEKEQLARLGQIGFQWEIGVGKYRR